MKYSKELYFNRLIDGRIEKILEFFDCILIEGPKLCGKTWTSINSTRNQYFLSDNKTFENVKTNIDFLFRGDQYPILIDEWQFIPSIWDYLRNRMDQKNGNEKYILTGSSSYKSLKRKK